MKLIGNRIRETYLALLVSDFDLPPFIANPAVLTPDQLKKRFKSTRTGKNRVKTGKTYR
jgi:hypothetical protein